MGRWKITLIAAALLLPLASPVFADVTFSTGLTVTGDAEIKTVKYDCEHHDPITVQYLNAAPNFLALVPVERWSATAGLRQCHLRLGREICRRANTSGGPRAMTRRSHDVTEGLDAAPVLTCTEEVDTP